MEANTGSSCALEVPKAMEEHQEVAPPSSKHPMAVTTPSSSEAVPPPSEAVPPPSEEVPPPSEAVPSEHYMPVPPASPALLAALRGWVRRLANERALFRPGLPLSQAFLDPSYLDTDTKARVAAQVAAQLQAMPGRGEGRKGEEGGERFYLYTLHDPTLAGAWAPFSDLAPVVDRHTRSLSSSSPPLPL